ncbi:MAG: HAMP domain-containing histidine kinase [Ruminococcus sp.]|nr:HAMP domain-containing histidine kinase [Ruminococcus sp.]
MVAAIVTLVVIICILLFLIIAQNRELGSIVKQMRYIGNKDTNILVRSERGLATGLINEINVMLKEIRKIRAEYKQKNHDLEQMITNISHDLRTPLTSAMGYINMVQHSDMSEEEKQRELAIIEKRLIRLEELINSFFEFSKIVSSGKKPELTQVNLISVLEESIVHYYDDYSSRERQIIFRCDKHKLMINSNQGMLMRIFDNLIGNSLKHGNGDLIVTVIGESEIKIFFENEPEVRNVDFDHIFDEFYTTDISRTKGNTGLGLAIAKQFTEMLGGEITAEPHDDVFRVSLRFFA